MKLPAYKARLAMYLPAKKEVQILVIGDWSLSGYRCLVFGYCNH